MREHDDGKVILQGEVLFDSGSGALKPEGTRLMAEIGAGLAPLLAADPHLEVNRLPAIWYEAVLRWGPMQTQQLSEVRQGGLRVLGYAGNSAPDHVDQLHSLPDYLEWIDW